MSAIIDIVDTSKRTPYQSAINNDMFIKTTESSQIHLGVPTTLTINRQAIAFNTKLSSTTSSVKTGTISSKVMGINKLEVKRPNSSSIKNSTGTYVQGYTNSNQNIILNSDSSNNSSILFQNNTKTILSATNSGIGKLNNCSLLDIAGFTTITHLNSCISVPSSDHNNIDVLFDSYLSNNQFKSSSSNITCQKMSKSNDMFLFNSVTANLADSNLSDTVPVFAISSNGDIGISTTDFGSKLSLNGNLATTKLFSDSFKIISLANQVNSFTFNTGLTTNTIYTSSSFRVNGGILVLDMDFSCSVKDPDTHVFIKTNLIHTTTNLIVISFSNNFFINKINDNRTFAFSRVLSNIPSGDYVQSLVLYSSKNTMISSSNYLSLSVTELPV